MLQCIRACVDPLSILKHFGVGDALTQMQVSPEARFRYTFPYKTQIPGDLVSGNPYFESLLHEPTSLFKSAPIAEGPSSSSAHSAKQHALGLNMEVPRQSQSMYLRLFHAAE